MVLVVTVSVLLSSWCIFACALDRALDQSFLHSSITTALLPFWLPAHLRPLISIELTSTIKARPFLSSLVHKLCALGPSVYRRGCNYGTVSPVVFKWDLKLRGLISLSHLKSIVLKHQSLSNSLGTVPNSLKVLCKAHGMQHDMRLSQIIRV